jgi:hypothetical protein
MTGSSQLATQLRLAFSGTAAVVVAVGSALTIPPPFSPLKAIVPLMSLSPALIFLLGIRSYRGALRFGPFLVLLTAIGWLGAGLMASVEGGWWLLAWSLNAAVLSIIGAIVDIRWRSEGYSTARQIKGLAAMAQARGASETVEQRGTISKSSRQTDSLAIIALVLGIAGIVCVPIILSIPAVIIGKRSENKIVASEGRLEGAQLARAGIVGGWLGIGLGIVALVLLLTFRS